MHKNDIPVFRQLMEQVLQKAIGKSLRKQSIGTFEEVSFKIEEGLDAAGVGARSLKNYASYLLDEKYDKINPSLKTLNTLVQYVWEKPTSEGLWHEYRMQYQTDTPFKPFLPTKSKNTLLRILLVCFIFTIIILLTSRKNSTKSFFYAFTNSDLSLLREDGWFLFPDSIDLEIWGNPKYRNKKLLTLETYPGDSFLDNRNYKTFVRNILAHKIDCGDCCRIQVKIVDFQPYQRYQQAGFFLFYKFDPVPSIRFTVADGETVAVKRDGEYSSSHIFFSENHKERAQIDGSAQLDSITLDLLIEKSHYFFSQKIDNRKFISIRSEKLPFDRPVYIGLAAFQGRPEIPDPVFPQADTIPAHFTSIRVMPCE